MVARAGCAAPLAAGRDKPVPYDVVPCASATRPRGGNFHGTDAEGSVATGGECSLKGRRGWAGGGGGAQRMAKARPSDAADPALGRSDRRRHFIVDPRLAPLTDRRAAAERRSRPPPALSTRQVIIGATPPQPRTTTTALLVRTRRDPELCEYGRTPARRSSRVRDNGLSPTLQRVGMVHRIIVLAALAPLAGA